MEGLLSDQAQPNQGVKQKFHSKYEALSRKHAMEYAKMHKDHEELVSASEKGEKDEVTKTSASGNEQKEEDTKDQELHRKMEEMLSMLKDLADKTHVCTSDPRYQEMLSFMTEKARRDTKKRMGEESTARREEVFVACESNKKKDEAQGNMGQQSATMLSDKRREDKREIEAGEVLGTHKSKLRYEDSREKKKLKGDETPKLLEKEEEEEKNSQTSEEEKL